MGNNALIDSMEEALNCGDKSFWVQNVGKKKCPHQRCALRHMEISLSSLGFQLFSTEKESSSLAQGQAHTVVPSALCSR